MNEVLVIEVGFAVQPTDLVHLIGSRAFDPSVAAVDLVIYFPDDYGSGINTNGQWRLCTKKAFGDELVGQFENPQAGVFELASDDHVLVCGLVGGHPTTVLRPR